MSKQQLVRVIKNNNLINYSCSCGNTGIWNNKSLTLQLEHKNGNNTDNRIENLEYLCPNCHSQTNTYGSKNKHNRVFENRIKDLLEYSDKYLSDDNIKILIEKWKVSEGTILRWVKLYHKKLINNGINILIKETNPLFNGIFKKDEKVHSERLEDLKDNDLNYKILSKKWRISVKSVRKWINQNKEKNK